MSSALIRQITDSDTTRWRRSAPGAGALLLFGFLAVTTGDSWAQDMPPTVRSPLAPSSWFVQAGTVRDTQSLTLGLTWDLTPKWSIGGGELTTYVEASFSGWSYDRAKSRGHSELAQLAVIPVARFRPGNGYSPWFFEAGLGATVTSKVYATQDKRFSTAFNFGTHVAIGRSFGDRRQHEFSLRVEHFSNAGIKHPNPGENFLQLRYAYRFM